jgi:hypothetical protein
MTKRQRSDSVKGVQEIFEGAGKTIDPPLGIDLGNGVRPYWDKLVNAKAARAWTDQDLLMLVELSRNLFKTERLSREMLYEDDVVEMGNAIKPNPKLTIIDQNVKRARMIMAMLQIHPEATQGKSREQVKQNQTHAEAKVAQQQVEEDSLLARPTH